MFGELRPVDGGTPILLDKPSLTIGHDCTCGVIIDHPSIRPIHCQMDFRDGYWFIESLSPEGEIAVNGQEVVESTWVPSLSVINIGAIEFDLQYSDDGSKANGQGNVTSAILTKLDRVLRATPTFKTRRIQLRVDQPIPSDLSKSCFGTLKSCVNDHAIPLLYEELYLGRDSDCDVIMPYSAVAKTHCVLRFQEGYWLIRDLNNNGITIDGKAVQVGWLAPGANLGIANHQFEMDYTTTATAPPPELTVAVNGVGAHDNDLSQSDDDSDVYEVDESALVDDDDHDLEVVETRSNPLNPVTSVPPVVPAKQPVVTKQPVPPRTPVPPAVVPPRASVFDEPLLSIDMMLESIESVADPSEEPESTVNAPVSSEPVKAATPISQPPTDLVAPPTALLSQPKAQVPSVAKTVRVPGKTETKKGKLKAPHLLLNPSSSLASSRPSLSNPDFVELRRNQVSLLLKARSCDSLLLMQPANIAWYTGGIEPTRNLSGQPIVALLLSAESAALLGRSSDVEAMIGSTELLVGLQHRACDWPLGSRELLAELGISGQLASDQPTDVGCDVSSEIATMRQTLSPLEIETLRKLGIRVTRAIEKAAREFQRGDTEAQIAGDVASRLVRHEVVPERIQIWGDGRGQSCPNWMFRRDAVEHFCTISVIARRQGLHVAVSRTVSFGTPPKELRWTYSDMLQTHMTAVHAICDQQSAATVIDRVKSACGTLGFVPDWSTTAPGVVTGYQPCEESLTSSSMLRLQAGMPLIWQSSLGPARAIDTLFVRKIDGKVVTQTGEWPLVSTTIDGRPLYGQAILQRTV